MPTLSPQGFKAVSELRQAALRINDAKQRKTAMIFLDCYKAVVLAAENSKVESKEDSAYLIRTVADFISFTAINAAPMIAAGASDPKILAQITTLIGQQVAMNIETFYRTIIRETTNEKVH